MPFMWLFCERVWQDSADQVAFIEYTMLSFINPVVISVQSSVEEFTPIPSWDC